MSQVAVNRLTNSNVYLNGASLLGKCAEVNLPELSTESEDHEALGMKCAVDFFKRYEKLTASFKWSSMYPEVLKEVSNPRKPVQLQVRGNLERHNSQGIIEEIPVVIFMTGRFTSAPGGNLRVTENVEIQPNFSATYYKQTIGGQDIVEIDALANIVKVDGENIFNDFDANIGG